MNFLGFARNIRLEHLRNLRRDDNHEPENDTNQKEHESWCLEECGRTLDPDENWLAVEYYRFEKAEKIAHRKKLAKQFGLTLAGLRTRVHRIRDSLRPCMEECLEKLASEML